MSALVLMLLAGRAVASPVPIGPRSLELRTLKAGRYAGPARAVLVARSARQWVREGERHDQSTSEELADLTVDKFEDGVMEFLDDGRREGVYDGMVFATVSDAARESRRNVAYAMVHFEQRGLKRSVVAGVPGAVLLGDFVTEDGQRPATCSSTWAAARSLSLTG